MISEIASVFAENFTDSKLRAMIEKSFVNAASMPMSSPSTSSVLFAVLASAIECFSSSSDESMRKFFVGNCSRDHPMTLCSSVPLAMIQASRGWICNQCSKVVPLFQKGTWYCETCS
jgi:hypothetical protein